MIGSAARHIKGAEEVLVARARLNDEGAIRALIQRNNRRLYRIVRAVLGDESEVEDVLQEAYLRAFRSLAGFQGQSAFATWLTRIALNEALQHLRKRRRTPIPSEAAVAAQLPEAQLITFPGAQPAPDPECAVARCQIREVIEAAVEQLPRPLRVVFVLRDIEELSVAETASHLGVPEATVKTRLHRARKQLRHQLQAEVAATLSGAFPFAGARCAQMADRVTERLRDGGIGVAEITRSRPQEASPPDEESDGLNKEEPAMMRNPRTTAQIAGHPIHPMLIPFPVAFLVATFVSDLVYWSTENAGWGVASTYLLGAALLMAGLAAVAGLIDFLGDGAIRQLSAAWHHMVGNVIVVLLSFWNWYRRYDAGPEAVLPLGIVISFLVVLILLYTGWRGWEMVYKHRVAVSDDR